MAVIVTITHDENPVAPIWPCFIIMAGNQMGQPRCRRKGCVAGSIPGLNIVIMTFCCNLTSGDSGASPASRNRGELETSPRCQTPGERLATGKNCMVLPNADILSGSVTSRTPCSGVVFADIGAPIALALLTEPRRRGSRRTFIG